MKPPDVKAGLHSLEETLSSRGKVRVLKVLVEMGELNISEIVRRIGLNYTTTSQHLRSLEKMEIVEEKRFGKIRIYRFNAENPRAKAIAQLIRQWETY
ncbi:MAG: winged helix-turn-helix domain-containing protein [Candidatus Bathyarchaeia archaeon]